MMMTITKQVWNVCEMDSKLTWVEGDELWSLWHYSRWLLPWQCDNSSTIALIVLVVTLSWQRFNMFKKCSILNLLEQFCISYTYIMTCRNFFSQVLHSGVLKIASYLHLVHIIHSASYQPCCVWVVLQATCMHVFNWSIHVHAIV